MPARRDLHKIFILGSGPIVIGQACEFDYSGSQACKALKEEGYQVVLVNSNPATIMTDPALSDRTYIEPLTLDAVTKIIDRERPDAILPTLGGQTALNLAADLARQGILEQYQTRLIGVSFDAIDRAEDRKRFKETIESIGLALPASAYVASFAEADAFARTNSFPLIIRPSFTLGGTGAGVAFNAEEYGPLIERALRLSPIGRVLVEQSLLGWKEFELEVMRDRADNVVIICPIENFDPMGIHTGDSITVAPAQTLTDREYQVMRDAAIAIIRAIGVETGGSNIQFAVHPRTGALMVIEMNPRVSRSSALASKATGFPIAKIAAKLAVGYTLDELPNDITRKTRASFEPTIDYCVVKVPRFAFEKFPDANPEITTQMKSVGEVMTIGRTFKEALQKALRGLETRWQGFGVSDKDVPYEQASHETLVTQLRSPRFDRIFYIRAALARGMTVDEVARHTGIDPWFLVNLKEIIDFQRQVEGLRPEVAARGLTAVTTGFLRAAKRLGFSDGQLAFAWQCDARDVRARRQELGIVPVVKCIDTCAAEFEAHTPYYYLTYEDEDERAPSTRKRVLIIGGGPNRIGQGIEFDYCCVHGAYALRDRGFEAIMVNSNPETVSTDYDTSDRLYFEPLTAEDVRNVIDLEKPCGVIAQFGGQTPLNLVRQLRPIPVLGTRPDAIDRAEDRGRFRDLLRRLGLTQPVSRTARSFEQAQRAAREIGYPVLVRPSYVIGGRAMEIVYSERALAQFVAQAVEAAPDHPLLVDKFIEDAVEVDVDAISDGTTTVAAGIMEHIEEAGIHSGDSSCVLPAVTLAPNQVAEIRRQTAVLARELGVRGLMNIQFAVKGDTIYVLEVNPRASRTVPFVSKALGVPLAKLATQIMVGATLAELGFSAEVELPYFAVKCPVFPFAKLTGTDPVLGPEMKSTGEVMGIDADFGLAFAKASIASGQALPTRGSVFVSVRNRDKRAVIFIAKKLADLGFELFATTGTAAVLEKSGLFVQAVPKVYEGRPNVIDMVKNRHIDLIINTPTGHGPRDDDLCIRKIALNRTIPCVTTIAGAQAAVTGIEALRAGALAVRSLQEYHAQLKPGIPVSAGGITK